MDELKHTQQNMQLNVCSTMIYTVIYVVLSDIIMLLCIKELLM